MKCIDCGQCRTVMLTQETVIGRRRVTWNICGPCWIAYGAKS